MTGLAFLATLGQRPEAITVALDALSSRYIYTVGAVLHTDPQLSGIAGALAALKAVLAEDYPALRIDYRVLTEADGRPLLDLTDAVSANAYHAALLDCLYHYRQEGYQLHLLVSGGRKAMSIYAMLAASILFEPPHDQVWTVLSPDALLAQPGVFHIPPGLRQEVQLVSLPIITERLAPGIDPRTVLERRESHAEQFLSKLTRTEKTLALLLKSHPYASNADLAAMLSKAEKTVENQFGSIYDKLIGYLRFGEQIDVNKRRQALLDVLKD